MDDELMAQIAALVGAFGSILLLVARSRSIFVIGFVLLVAAGIGLSGSLYGESLVDRASAPTAAVAALGAIALSGAAVLLVRWPGAIIPLLAAAAPFRPPIDFGAENRFLVSVATDGRIGRLLPLYGILAAASLATVFRVVRTGDVPALPSELAYPAALLTGIIGASLLWSYDVPLGTDQLLFFLLPTVLLLAIVARAPVRPWLTRALFVVTVAITALFAAVGLWEAYAKELIFATARVEVGNVYADFFRVTSLFNDPSLYGRHVVVGITVVLVAMWAKRMNVVLAAALITFLWLGLFFSYSQSSMIALIATVVAVALIMGDRRARAIVLIAVAVIALAGGTAVASSVQDNSLGRVTSDRSRRANLTGEVFLNHSIVGVGVGGHPAATAAIAPRRRPKADFVSHTTPLTIAAELGLVGLIAYVALLAGSVVMLNRVRRIDEALGVGLLAVFLALFVHSLFYGGFFEDPVTWLVLGVGAAVLAASRASSVTTPGSAAAT